MKPIRIDIEAVVNKELLWKSIYSISGISLNNS